ncbi:MAG: ABC transporter permease, partial [Actinomycetota bacterium]|nr:ABC transporter permease [Actinomycetota bacterium]
MVIIVGALISPFFFTLDNARNILSLASVVGILSIGQGFVIISGGAGIDLSVGSTLGLSGVVGALMGVTYGPVGVIVGALGTGLFVGVLNALGIAVAGLQPFIMTLGTLTIASGAAFYLSGSNPIRMGGGNSLPWLTEELGFVPVSVIVFLIVGLVSQFILSRTVFGRQIYVIGGNEEAARFAGIPVMRRRMTVYMVSGLLAGLGALILISRLATADPAYGRGYELATIAAVVVGGAPLTGGVGSIGGVMVGVLVIQCLSNILDLLNVNSQIQAMIQGVIIIAVVAFNRRGTTTGREALIKSLPLIIGLI